MSHDGAPVGGRHDGPEFVRALLLTPCGTLGEPGRRRGVDGPMSLSTMMSSLPEHPSSPREARRVVAWCEARPRPQSPTFDELISAAPVGPLPQAKRRSEVAFTCEPRELRARQ